MPDISKQAKEYNVFKRFARVCTHYPIAFSTIVIGDNPDVQCRLIDGSEKWFELTEIIDPNYLAVRKARRDFDKILKNFLLNDKLFLLTFKHKKVAISFSRSFTNRAELKKNLPRLLSYLHELNVKKIKEINPKNVFNFIDYITITDSKYDARVRVPNAQFVGIPIKERLDDKFNKRYSKDCDLILYYDKLTVFSQAVPYEDIIDYIKNKKESPFQKIWIFSLKDDSILFEYPEDTIQKLK